MDNQDKLLEDIEMIVGIIKELHDLAYVQYSHLVDVVLEGALTDEKQIEHILDGILDFGDDLRFLDLSKILCRHIYYQYPQLVGNFVKLPKEIYDKASEILAKQGLTMENALSLFFEETVRLGRIPFEYTEEDLEEVSRWEKMMNDDLCDV